MCRYFDKKEIIWKFQKLILKLPIVTGKAGSPPLYALRAYHYGSPALSGYGNSRGFGFASPAQAAEAFRADQTPAIAFIIFQLPWLNKIFPRL